MAQAILNDAVPLALPALLFLLDRAGLLPAGEPAPAPEPGGHRGPEA